MPANMQRLIRDKDMILSTIQSRGPCLPIQIARSVNLSLLFASAFLSELYSERRIKMSHMRVGSSPLYYLPGQEAQLENFVEHLNQREKEAFYLIKKERLLQDEKQEPAIRVALREIRDFAIPFKREVNSQDKIFWRYHAISDEEAFNLIHEMLNPSQKRKEKIKEEKPQEKEKQNTLPQQIPVQVQDQIQEIKKEITAQQNILEQQIKPSQASQMSQASEEHQKQKRGRKTSVKNQKPVEFKFPKNVKDYLTNKDIELLQIIEEAKSSLTAKVRIDTMFGKQEYYLIAKDKKKIGEQDIINALHKAQLEKMPSLILAPGDIDKKSLDFHKDFKNLVKFEKVKF